MKKNRFLRQNAVTFIEIMIVVVIMAAIAALAGPALFSQFGGAQVNNAKTEMGSIISALELYNLDNKKFPSTEQGLDALIKKPSLGIIPENWNGPYLKGNAAPDDPWGNNYLYENSGQIFTLKTFGADGLEGGDGNNKDLSCSPQSCNY